MRVTYLLVAFLAGARSFKAVERRAKPMGKGGGGVVARSVVEAAIQALALDDKIAARHAVNAVRRTFPGHRRGLRARAALRVAASARAAGDALPRRVEGGRRQGPGGPGPRRGRLIIRASGKFHVCTSSRRWRGGGSLRYTNIQLPPLPAPRQPPGHGRSLNPVDLVEARLKK